MPRKQTSAPGKKNSAKPLRVGFDLDGVILYNPARFARPLIAFVKKFVLKKRGLKFYYPKHAWEIKFWQLVHKSSLFTSPGLKEIEALCRQGRITAYVVTARYSFLKNDFLYWMKKIRAGEYFAGTYFNEDNEQPHLFKERMFKKLNLDYFVEDNWNIVQHLNSKYPGRVFWICNLLDHRIPHPLKFTSLGKAVKNIKTRIRNKE